MGGREDREEEGGRGEEEGRERRRGRGKKTAGRVNAKDEL